MPRAGYPSQTNVCTRDSLGGEPTLSNSWVLIGHHQSLLGFGSQVLMAKLSGKGAWQSTEPGHGAKQRQQSEPRTASLVLHRQHLWLPPRLKAVPNVL